MYDESEVDPLEYNLRHNLNTRLKMELIKASKHYMQDSYFQLGEDMGEIVALLTRPVPVIKESEPDTFEDGHKKHHYEKKPEHDDP